MRRLPLAQPTVRTTVLLGKHDEFLLAVTADDFILPTARASDGGLYLRPPSDHLRMAWPDAAVGILT